MKDILRLGSTLFAICAIAALALGLTDNITKPIIEERNIQANNESRKEVLSSAEEFKIVETAEPADTVKIEAVPLTKDNIDDIVEKEYQRIKKIYQ